MKSINGATEKVPANGNQRDSKTTDPLLAKKSLVILNGAPGRARTCDLLIRSQTLYPTELRVHGTDGKCFARNGKGCSHKKHKGKVLLVRFLCLVRLFPLKLLAHKGYEVLNLCLGHLVFERGHLFFAISDYLGELLVCVPDHSGCFQ